MSDPPKSRSGGARGSPKLPAVVPPGAKANDKRALILAAIRVSGLPPRQAAMSVGVSSSAYYRLAEDPTFVAAIEEATAVFARGMAAVVARAASRLGSWKAASWWLERRMPESFGPRLDLHVDVEPTVEDQMAEAMTTDQLDAEFERLAIEALSRLPDDRLDTILTDRRRRRQAAGVGSADRTPAEP